MSTTIEKITENNLEAIERRVQSITGENRIDIEDHFQSRNGKYILSFGGKKEYMANSWDRSRSRIQSYLEGIYNGCQVNVSEAPEENEYEWCVSVSITK